MAIDLVKNTILEVEKLKSEKKYKEALDILQEALKTKNDDYRIYEEIADIYIYEWKIQKAKKAIEYAIKLNPDSSTWNYLKGFILLTSNKIEDAIFYLEKSNSLIWNNAEVLRNLWWAYSMLWDLKRWIIILKRALNIMPNDPLIIEDLAMSLLQTWDIEKANELLISIWKDTFKI